MDRTHTRYGRAGRAFGIGAVALALTLGGVACSDETDQDPSPVTDDGGTTDGSGGTRSDDGGTGNESDGGPTDGGGTDEGSGGGSRREGGAGTDDGSSGDSSPGTIGGSPDNETGDTPAPHGSNRPNPPGTVGPEG